MYRIFQDKEGLVVTKEPKNGLKFTPAYDKGCFEEFEYVERFFQEHYKGLYVGLKTNFNSGERLSLLQILWDGHRGIGKEVWGVYQELVKK